MIIIKSLFSRNAGNRRLGGLSSLVATWVVIMTTCGANSDVISGCRLDDLLFAVLLLTEYLQPFYCDIYITEMCMKILYIVLLCLETYLSLHLFLFSPKEASTISQFYRRRWHRVLASDSVRCHRWRWGSVGVVGLTVFGLRCPINIIFTPDLLWYPHNWNVEENLLYHIITVFLLFKLKTGDRWLDGFVVAGGTVGCHGDNLRCYRWHLGSLTLRSTVFFGLQCSIDMTFTPDLPW